MGGTTVLSPIACFTDQISLTVIFWLLLLDYYQFLRRDYFQLWDTTKMAFVGRYNRHCMFETTSCNKNILNANILISADQFRM